MVSFYPSYLYLISNSSCFSLDDRILNWPLVKLAIQFSKLL